MESQTPGLRLQSSSHSSDGSMGMARCTKYTVVARVAALASNADPGGMKWDTSAMWTPIRQRPLPRSSTESASSRSLAVGGSIVNVLHAQISYLSWSRQKVAASAQTSDTMSPPC